ncbi:Vacuolar protein sorting-associated protein VTA1 [Hypsizygus marmoreus]|uniref:Vacuolar protein sorting-associated protein VTA1 n=1 Tax=Hypsizygus marmoreus TaxID=39966 RepID=A0A369KB78_HYPMA|nr:Vacuolar protein sorting-associated protein VTA1 [Hypsizygus marmoreus]
MSLLGLPPISSPLKSISPYLQRAHELRSQDPIMAYWCAYYAAQVGISLKAKDTASRDVLFALLGTLERLKKEIGANDAVDIESVSSAYVENFALKVFAMADNEDRKGAATRSTAKKFLAAANFLEVLKTFPKSEVSESNEEKIRYSKWKAAEIARAFREGRKPTPGPAGSDLQQDADLTPPAPPPSTKLIPIGRSSPNQASGSGSSPPSVKRASPPTHVDIPRSNQAPFASQPQTPPRSTVSHLDVEGHARLGVWGGEGEATPGSWSTAATPGTAYGPSDDWADQASPTRTTIEKKRDQNLRSGSGSSSGSGGSGGNGSDGGLKQNKAWVSDEIDSDAANQYYALHGNGGAMPDSAGTTGSDGSSKKSVHFTPSVVGGLSDSSVSNSSVPTSPSYDERNFEGGGWPTNQPPPVLYGGSPPPVPGAIDMSILPPGFVPDPHHFLPTGVAPPPTTLVSPPSPPNTNYYPSPQPPAPIPSAQNFYAAPPPPQLIDIPTPLPVFELTPSIIAKAQKHCRFAISSLDYEDAEQARKELRAALAILGG